MADSPGDQSADTAISSIRLEISAGAILTVGIAVVIAIVTTGVVVASRHVLSWVIACAVAAALIELAVDWFDRYMHRVVAIILVLIAVAGVASVLAFGVMHDLDREVHRLQVAAPQAAHDLESSKQFGKTAREVNLEERVQTAVDRLRSPSSGLAGQAVSSVGAYTVCSILTILFLSWGPRLARTALSELEGAQRERIQSIAASAFMRARRYVGYAILQAIAVGLIGFGVAKLDGLPAPAPLAVGLAIMTLIPNIGIIIGAIPIILLAGGLAPANDARLTVIGLVILQTISGLFIQPWIVRTSRLYVGPAIVSIAFLAGFELYGIGGALYGAALFVLAIAVIDAFEAENDELPIRDPVHARLATTPAQTTS